MSYGHSLRVLIVDDCPDHREVILRHLRRIAFLDINIYQAKDGVEAVAIMDQITPHIVITDTNMPRMNGIELLQYVRSNLRFTKVIVLFGGLTGSKVTESDVQAMGAELVVSKPDMESKLLPYLRSKTLGWWLFLQMRKTLESESTNRGLQ